MVTHVTGQVGYHLQDPCEALTIVCRIRAKTLGLQPNLWNLSLIPLGTRSLTRLKADQLVNSRILSRRFVYDTLVFGLC